MRCGPEEDRPLSGGWAGFGGAVERQNQGVKNDRERPRGTLAGNGLAATFPLGIGTPGRASALPGETVEGDCAGGTCFSTAARLRPPPCPVLAAPIDVAPKAEQ